jgi:hypothetical protein
MAASIRREERIGWTPPSLSEREHWRRAHKIVLIWSASRRMASAPGAMSSLSALPSESVVMSRAVLGLGAKAKAQSDRARSDIGREQRCTQKFVAQRPEQPPTPEPIQLPLSSSFSSKQSSERKEASSVIGVQEFPCCSVCQSGTASPVQIYPG